MYASGPEGTDERGCGLDDASQVPIERRGPLGQPRWGSDTEDAQHKPRSPGENLLEDARFAPYIDSEMISKLWIRSIFRCRMSRARKGLTPGKRGRY